jgi:hypothetical protein
MEFGLDKCTTIVLKHGKLTKNQNISLNIQTVKRNMELDKYLGIEEGGGIDISQLKDKLVKEYYHWIRQIVKTELNLKNKITGINILAMPVLAYSFGIGNWLTKEIEKTDLKQDSI